MTGVQTCALPISYHYEVNELNESIKKIMQDTGMEAHSAIYCIVKHALLKEFTGKDIIINGLYIDDADVIYALNRISAINK